MRFPKHPASAVILCFTLLLVSASPARSFLATTSAPTPADAAASPAYWQFAPIPPMGWNSYDAFGDTVTEAEVLANAQYVKKNLLSHGWNYIVIDFRWYDPEPPGNDFLLNKLRSGATLPADSFGRLQPAVNRFPSSANGEGFKPLADKLHKMGLKFGIHYMRGIPEEAVRAETPIADSPFTAADAGDPSKPGEWCPDMFAVRDNPAGQAWYDSLFKQFAAWGVDFVKVDDISPNYRTAESEMIRRAIDKSGRPIVYSISAGPPAKKDAENVATHTNMWRISSDFWDRWSSLNHQFDLMAPWHDFIGPGHYADADMIPFGHIAIRSKAGGDDRVSRFSHDEQRMLMSFWCLAPSPLMLGGNLPDNTPWDLSLLTNDEVLTLDKDPLVIPATRVSQSNGVEVWVKPLANGSKAIGLFNRTSSPTTATLDWSSAKLTGKQKLRDLWQHKNLGTFNHTYSTTLPAHASLLLTAKPQ